MPSDNDSLESRIRRAGAEARAPRIDVEQVKAGGLRRRRHRRNIAAAVAGLGALLVIVSGIALGADNTEKHVTATFNPGCAPFGAYLTSAASPSDGRLASLTVSAGSIFKLNAVIPSTEYARYTSLTIIVAKPGSTVDVGPPEKLPTTSAGRAENQLATQKVTDPAGAFATDLQSPTAPGSYAIVAYGQYVTANDCRNSIPSDPAEQSTGTYAFEMGTLIVG